LNVEALRGLYFGTFFESIEMAFFEKNTSVFLLESVVDCMHLKIFEKASNG